MTSPLKHISNPREVFDNLPEGTLAELIDNVLFMSPSPIYGHQEVLLNLASELRDLFKQNGQGKVAIAPFDIHLDERNIVQPDVVIILDTNLSQLKEDEHFYGTPDFLIEILSPFNRSHDVVRKKKLYQQFGVKEYWIIDPKTRRAQGFSLQGATYVLVQDEPGRIKSPLLNTKIEF
ncbi:Uma2 family endonuclease [Chryseolinea lacunae]|uniref:Uma2 family endonuclease n=1 Tax=Chryseolinea lacunae TaxID=2801331 RepID=A0ABS1KR89_9BACT|nr:Uma2 family endonuclease [Chryseolinea lacunae]MBL0741941.1 Uma2 family endonuclease [Chryseolinea lacunae]